MGIFIVIDDGLSQNVIIHVQQKLGVAVELLFGKDATLINVIPFESALIIERLALVVGLEVSARLVVATMDVLLHCSHRI